MSGGIAQLIAVGAQDVHLVGQPEVSFFRSTYKRHTNFSQTVERQVIQGNVGNNGMSSVRFERKGDLLAYVYLMPINTALNQAKVDVTDWSTYIAQVELLIGGQVIDTQDVKFTQEIAPDLLSTNLAKSTASNLYRIGSNAGFYPFRFSFCENWQSAIPLIALQYHDVEIRIKWGSNATSVGWECYANYVYLDTEERADISSKPISMLITQVQKSIASGQRMQELNFNHPVKFLVASNQSNCAMLAAGNKLKMQINGVDIADFKFANPNFSAVTSYYHLPFAGGLNTTKMFVYPFCLETAKLQPTGSLNFSRLDSARIINDTANSSDDIYAVNYNVLRIQNGMGGLVYAN